MRNKPLVSILIPTYNSEKYLSDAIDSSLAQTYKNIEIIIHDDASTDGTQDVLKKYRNKRLKVIYTKSNHGMIGGWNYILKQAKGEFVKYIASDDLISPKCIEEELKMFAVNKNISLVVCKRKIINSKGRVVKTLQFSNKTCVADGIEIGKEILTTIRENRAGEPTAALFRKKDAIKAGMFDKDYSQYADFEFWIRLLTLGDLGYVNKPLCSFRMHEGSNTSAAIRDGRYIDETFRLIGKYYDNKKYSKIFGLTAKDKDKVTKMKIADFLKTIKELVLNREFKIAMAHWNRIYKSARGNGVLSALGYHFSR